MLSNSYNLADQQLHRMSQFLARINRAYATPKEDDSHTNMAFDSLGCWLAGRWLDHQGKKLLPILELPALQFHLLDENLHKVSCFDPCGHNMQGALRAMGRWLRDLGFNRDPFLEPLNYEIPVYQALPAIIEGLDKSDFDLWTKIRRLAQASCHQLLIHFQLEGEVRIWPHHFDTGIYFEPLGKLGLGFGFAMADDAMGESYFYYAPYGLMNQEFHWEDRPELSHGEWRIGKWNGAVLPLSQVEPDSLRIFLKQVSNYYLKQ